LDPAPIGAKAELKLLHESAILVAPPVMRLRELAVRLGRNFIGFNVLGVERPIVIDDVGTGIPRIALNGLIPALPAVVHEGDCFEPTIAEAGGFRSTECTWRQ
jgi:hypothetical protein